MAHTCELYFFVKMTLKKPTKFVTLHTVVWNLGRQEALHGTTKQLKVGVSESIRLGGAFAQFLGVEVSHQVLPGMTQQQAIALLDDPTFTFKDDAIAISLHCASVSMSDEVEPHPFCVPAP